MNEFFMKGLTQKIHSINRFVCNRNLIFNALFAAELKPFVVDSSSFKFRFRMFVKLFQEVSVSMALIESMFVWLMKSSTGVGFTSSSPTDEIESSTGKADQRSFMDRKLHNSFCSEFNLIFDSDSNFRMIKIIPLHFMFSALFLPSSLASEVKSIKCEIKLKIEFARLIT